MNIKQISTNSLIITFSNIISQEISLEVQKAYAGIKTINTGIFELIPSYTSIFISYDIKLYNFDNMKAILEDKISHCESLKNNQNEIVNIDVYYGLEVGLDLNKISLEKNISVEEIIHIHSQKIYDVYAIGFLPGYGYLGEVDERITSARLKSPRKKIRKGSVGIADTQTAVYPQDSAGGWNIIGNTTKELFDETLEELSPLSVGKKVKFNPITKNEYLYQGGVL